MQVSMRNRSLPPWRSPRAEARQLRSRADRPGDEPASTVGLEVAGNLTRQAGCGDVEFVGAFGDFVFRENRRERPERRCLDGVDADGEERLVHRANDVGAGEAQHLVAALEGRPTKVVGSEIEALDEGSECSVENDDALVEGFEVGLACHETHKLSAHDRA
jgi:hypothetical protein